MRVQTTRIRRARAQVLRTVPLLVLLTTVRLNSCETVLSHLCLHVQVTCVRRRASQVQRTAPIVVFLMMVCPNSCNCAEPFVFTCADRSNSINTSASAANGRAAHAHEDGSLEFVRNCAEPFVFAVCRSIFEPCPRSDCSRSS